MLRCLLLRSRGRRCGSLDQVRLLRLLGLGRIDRRSGECSETNLTRRRQCRSSSRGLFHLVWFFAGFSGLLGGLCRRRNLLGGSGGGDDICLDARKSWDIDTGRDHVRSKHLWAASLRCGRRFCRWQIKRSRLLKLRKRADTHDERTGQVRALRVKAQRQSRPSKGESISIIGESCIYGAEFEALRSIRSSLSLRGARPCGPAGRPACLRLCNTGVPI